MPLGENHTDRTSADVFIPLDITLPGESGDRLLLENGDLLLLESGDAILKE